jgi:transcriptional regulatory protein LEU3
MGHIHFLQGSNQDRLPGKAQDQMARPHVCWRAMFSIPNGSMTASCCMDSHQYFLFPCLTRPRFFTQYHPLFPILDASLGPNDYYELSPFLFWTIIVIGSRRYADDPNVLDKSSQLITPLAFSSMALRSSPMPVIQGLLLLCTWRLPTNSMYKDMTHLMCGSAVHLATQIGLHISGVGQDFARMPVKKDQEQKVFRARLWLCCVIVSIR